MSDWKERLSREQIDLIDKIEKLMHFIATAKVDGRAMALLREQVSIMNEYLQVLNQRIYLIQEREHDRNN